jgi:hypothetical protein
VLETARRCYDGRPERILDDLARNAEHEQGGA